MRQIQGAGDVGQVAVPLLLPRSVVPGRGASSAIHPPPSPVVSGAASGVRGDNLLTHPEPSKAPSSSRKPSGAHLGGPAHWALPAPGGVSHASPLLRSRGVFFPQKHGAFAVPLPPPPPTWPSLLVTQPPGLSVPNPGPLARPCLSPCLSPVSPTARMTPYVLPSLPGYTSTLPTRVSRIPLLTHTHVYPRAHVHTGTQEHTCLRACACTRP